MTEIGGSHGCNSVLEHRSQIRALNLGAFSCFNFPSSCEATRKLVLVQFQDKFFERTDGAAMGSSPSPVIVDLFMENLEE